MKRKIYFLITLSFVLALFLAGNIADAQNISDKTKVGKKISDGDQGGERVVIDCPCVGDNADLTPPVLANLPTGVDLGCNPTPPSCDLGVTATDDCTENVQVQCTPGEITGDDCNKTQVFNYYPLTNVGMMYPKILHIPGK